MSVDETSESPLPAHPALREIALMLDDMGMWGEILDDRFRSVFCSRELVRAWGVSADEARGLIGTSMVARVLDERYAGVIRPTPESQRAWMRHNLPIMRHYLQPEDPDFVEVFGSSASYAASVEPVEGVPRAWSVTMSFPHGLRFRRSMLGDQKNGCLRINDDDGRFIGVLYLSRGMMGENLLHRLGRGDQRLFERMERVSEPGRRAASILFADLEASGPLSRRLSSHAYFRLIRDLTDLIDSSVIARDGIVGKHAGDGGSALFLAADFEGSESAAARSAIDTARAIRDAADQLGPDEVSVKLNIGVHWGATLMVGQVATGGRLEVTALGDEMNEAARIEAAANGGAILASKGVIERLDAADAQATGIDPDALAYTPLWELDGVSEKAVRDAGSIAVAAI